MSNVVSFRTLAVLAFALRFVSAQDDPVIGYHTAAAIGWSTVTNASPVPVTSSQVVIAQPGSPWLKIWFASADLGAASKIRVHGVQDGVEQILDAAAYAAWSGTSAYFNGDTVLVDLIVAPNDSASAIISGFDAGFVSVPEPDSICGTTDDRVLATERRVGRLLNSSMNAICSGGIVSTNSCYLTAGHCVSGGSVFSVEFNCPPSTASGTVVHPGPQDQYPLISGTLAFLNGGVGMDWGIARLANNTTTGLPPALVQGYYNLAPALPAVGSITRITGFGTASGVRNQACTTHTGPNTQVGGTNGTTLKYQVDTTGGNSGSSVVLQSNQTVYGVHTHAGCTSTGGANQGTAITFPGLQAHYAAICNPGPTAYTVSATQAGAGAPVVLTVSNAPASSEIYNVISTTPATPTNSGPTAGLVIGANELLLELGFALGTEPFHVLADATGSYAFSVPTSFPGTPISIDVVSVAFTPGGGFNAYLGRSPAVNATVSI